MPNLSKISYKGTTYDIYDAAAQHSPYALPVADFDTLGGVMPLYSNTNAVSGVTAAGGAKSVAVNTISTTAGKYYAIEIDKDGRLYVNVPWTDDNTTYEIDDASAIADPSGFLVTLTKKSGTAGSTTSVTIPVFQGCDPTNDGALGLVPKPTTSDAGMFLCSNGVWATPTNTNTTYTLSGGDNSGSTNYQVKLTTTGSQTQGDAGVATIPYFGAAVGGLLPAYTGGSASDAFFSAAGWKSNPFNKYYIWFADVETNMGTVPSGTGHGNWDVTFPTANKNIGAGVALTSVSGFSGTPKVGDTVITKGGFIGQLTNVDSQSTGYIATFVGRLSFMAFNTPTAYDSSTQTLTLGSY